MGRQWQDEGERFKPKREKFRSEARKILFTQWVVTPWNRSPRDVVDVPSLEVQGHVGWGPMQPGQVGGIPSCVITAHNRVLKLDDLYGSFHPSLSQIKFLMWKTFQAWLLHSVQLKSPRMRALSANLHPSAPWYCILMAHGAQKFQGLTTLNIQ